MPPQAGSENQIKQTLPAGPQNGEIELEHNQLRPQLEALYLNIIFSMIEYV